MAYLAPGAAPPAVLLADYARRLEFAQLAAPAPPPPSGAPRPPGLHLHALQVFAERFLAPETPIPRLLLGWDTGTGKSIAAIVVGQKFAQRFREMAQLPPEARPTVFILGFTRQVIQAEMLRDPRHGFVTAQDLAELRRLRSEASGQEPGSPAVRRYAGYLGTLRRQVTDRARGGYFRFFGYKDFATRLFQVTPRGEREGFNVLELFLRPGRGGAPPEGRQKGGEDDQRGRRQGEEDVGAPPPEGSGSAMELFVRRIAAAERAGRVRVNQDLLAQLRHGLVIADEIHNVYNQRDPNMYGVALQFALDAFPPAEAPRALFMSATPVAGSPAEVVDLLNLLVPRADLPGGRPLARDDFFAGGGAGAAFRPGALAEITRLAAGRTTRLAAPRAPGPAGARLFPEYVFLGRPLDGVPYLKFVTAPATAAQRAAQAAAGLRPGVLPAAADYALYDMVFPDPSGEAPLYASPASAPLREVYLRAPPAWRAAHGVAVEPLPATLGVRGPPPVGGPFLSLGWKGKGGIRALSAKYARWLEATVGRLKARVPGKALAYHKRISGTGCALLAAALAQNGFVALGEGALPTTLCAVCGTELRRHRGGHPFRPARYGLLVGAGSMEATARERAFAAFNAPANREGHELRVLLGSAAVQEGLDFADIRNVDLLSVPDTVADLIQIVGRGPRRGSRPPGGRVEVSVFLTVAPKGSKSAPPPDEVKLRRAVRAFLLTQRSAAALWRGSANNFLPRAAAAAARPASLEGVPYAPLAGPQAAAAPAGPAPAGDDTYYAYNYAADAVLQATAALRVLFGQKTVWRRKELLAALRAPRAVAGLPLNAGTFSEGLVDLAVGTAVAAEAATARDAATGGVLAVSHALGGPPRRVVPLGDFYAAVPVAAGRPVVDVEAAVRTAAACGGGRGGAAVPLAAYARDHLQAANFEQRLEQFTAEFGRPGRPPRDLLVDYDADFQYALLARLVTEPGLRGRAFDAARGVYAEFGVTVSAGQLRAAAGVGPELARRAASGRAKGAAVGYVTPLAVKVWLPAERGAAGGWQNLPLGALGLNPRGRAENRLVVGYTEVRGAQLRFKIRKPLRELERSKVRDARSLDRGAVCETRPRAAQLALARRLKGGSAGELARLSATGLCRLIRSQLLAEEAAARKRKGGARWFYLFNEAVPTATLKS